MTTLSLAPALRPTLISAQPQECAEPVLLHEFFERAAQRWPDRCAIDVPPSSTRPDRSQITYAQLQRQSAALALQLREVVTQAEGIVAILLPRAGEHLYLSQLAILKAGAAYTCIDPIFPDDQVNAILQDSGAVGLLTDAAGMKRAERIQHTPACVLNVVAGCERLSEPVELASPSWLTPAHLAYLIYTSGTTGHPKGVMIEHQSIANLVRGDLQELGIKPEDRIGQSSSPAYDSSVEETWFALAAGATLVVMDEETTRLGPDLIPWLRRERITMFCPPPTMLRATGCAHPDLELPELRLLHAGGEALPTDVAERWARGRRLVNDYGPTESTVTALRGHIVPGAPITIGQPVPGVKAWVLDANLNEVNPDELGELCLGGGGLARGYLHEPELTARKFPLHPRLGRIYRTGDLVHRDTTGNYYCHGRIDSQVKVRGYRIELEAIEARLVECPGVREAACRVQGEGAQQRLVAFVVSAPEAGTISLTSLKQHLHQVLPWYMVPTHFGLLAELPRSVSGKLERKRLPVLELQALEEASEVLAPRNKLEENLVLAFGGILRVARVSIQHDFFNDLGGNSLLAAQLISRLRADPQTAALTVRDLYEARTVAELAKRVDCSPTSTGSNPSPTSPRSGEGLQSSASPPRNGEGVGGRGPASPGLGASPSLPTLSAAQRSESRNPPGGRGESHPILSTVIQTLWLVLILLLGAPVAYLLAFQVLPYLVESLGLVSFLLLAPLIYLGGLLVYTGLTVGVAVAVKKLLIGRYRPLRAPVWGSFYVRNWIVQQTVRLIPWRFLEGTLFQQLVLRALGARIGRRVHLHRGVNLLNGGWDLLEIGADVTVSQDASLRLVELEEGQIVVGPITLESGCTLDIRAAVASHTHLEANGYLTALSFLPRFGRIPQGQQWDGVPARPAGATPAAPTLPAGQANLSPVLHSLTLLAGRVGVGLLVALPLELLALAFALLAGLDAEHALDGLLHFTLHSWVGLMGVALITLAVPLRLLAQVCAMQLLGRVTPGVVSRWSPGYVRIWLKTELLEAASFWLSGTLLWPVWLRWAGMKIGRGCEISSIIDTLPELVEIGEETFFADGIYLGGPRIQRGTVTLAPVRLGKNTFLGNHAVIAAGQQLPDDVLFGVCTVADDRRARPGTSWFGHPPFELPRREVVECDRRFTHEPPLIRRINRVFWELLRFTLPLAPVLLALVWLQTLAAAEVALSLPCLLLAVVPLLDLGFAAALCLLVLVLKWFLLGRVRPGTHPLWSCWCSRWDFHYVAWDFYARGPLSALEGTVWLTWYLRAMGVKIGRSVVLGSGFAHVVDPDMLEFADGVTVSCLFQAHTFEDRVLKIDRVIIRRGATVGNSAVLLYGADIGEGTYVLPHSVVMKRERLLPGRAYGGCPTRTLPQESLTRAVEERGEPVVSPVPEPRA